MLRNWASCRNVMHTYVEHLLCHKSDALSLLIRNKMFVFFFFQLNFHAVISYGSVTKRDIAD